GDGEADVWETPTPESGETPLLGSSGSTATLDASGSDTQRTLYVGATQGTTALNDLYFTLAGEVASGQNPTTQETPSKNPTSNPATPISLKIISNNNPNGDSGNNGDVTGKT